MNPRSFPSVEAYNAAYPDCPIPTDPTTRHGLRGYQAAMSGVTDDVTGTEGSLTLDFLPGGAPGPHEGDRTGTVVATRWGDGPVLVLAEHISLREAWRAITDQWPTRLSEVGIALTHVPSSPAGQPGLAG